VVVATTVFADLARRVAVSFGLPDARLAVIDHPLGGIPPDSVDARADAAADAVVALLTRR
jgi:hypothetical protein